MLSRFGTALALVAVLVIGAVGPVSSERSRLATQTASAGSFEDLVESASSGPEVTEYLNEHGVVLSMAEASEIDATSRFIGSIDPSLFDELAIGGRFVPVYVSPESGDVVVLAGPESEAEVTRLVESKKHGDESGRRVRVEVIEFEPDLLVGDLLSGSTTLLKDRRVEGLQIDWMARRLVITMTKGSSSTDQMDLSSRAAELRIGTETTLPLVLVSSEARDEEASCFSRWAGCSDPMESGIQIRRGGENSKGICTLGFFIKLGSHEEAVTSGHCGVSGSDWWYVKAVGLLGNETANLIATNNTDIMRVDAMDPNQDSNRVFDESLVVVSSRFTVQGEPICTSLGKSRTVRCGTTVSNAAAWWSGTCGCQVYGADSSMSAVRGDSGSPVYALSIQPSGLTAVGVLATTGGHFADIQYALNQWGATIRN